MVSSKSRQNQDNHLEFFKWKFPFYTLVADKSFSKHYNEILFSKYSLR